MTTLFFPERARNALWAILALNVETALIKDHTKDLNIGKMRIAWWREEVRKTFQQSPPNHPVLVSLAESLQDVKLSQIWISKLLAARERNLADAQYLTLAELEQYAEDTASAVTSLKLECLGIINQHADHAASHAGKAIGVANALRATPFHVSKRLLNLPADIMAKVIHQLLYGPSTS